MDAKQNTKPGEWLFTCFFNGIWKVTCMHRSSPHQPPLVTCSDWALVRRSSSLSFPPRSSSSPPPSPAPPSPPPPSTTSRSAPLRGEREAHSTISHLPILLLCPLLARRNHWTCAPANFSSFHRHCTSTTHHWTWPCARAWEGRGPRRCRRTHRGEVVVRRVHGGDFHLPSSPDVSHPPFYCSDHCLTTLLTAKKVSTCFEYLILSLLSFFSPNETNFEIVEEEKKRNICFHLVLMTLVPTTSAATPTAPTSTPGKTTVASTTLRIWEVQVTYSGLQAGSDKPWWIDCNTCEEYLALPPLLPPEVIALLLPWLPVDRPDDRQDELQHFDQTRFQTFLHLRGLSTRGSSTRPPTTSLLRRWELLLSPWSCLRSKVWGGSGVQHPGGEERFELPVPLFQNWLMGSRNGDSEA